MNKPLAHGSVIGILGGGQLGRMLSVAASRLGYKTHIFEPTSNPPAGDVAFEITTAPYSNEEALERFAKSVDIITYEFENIPTDALDILERVRPIHPNREALRVSQDRCVEKQFLNKIGLKTAPFADVSSLKELEAAVNDIGAPSILKTRRFGYDGKGQVRLTPESNLAETYEAIGEQLAVLEGFVSFIREVSVIGARNAAGDVACFDPGENVHKDGILDTTTVPAQISAAQRMDAVLLTAKIMNALEYVGVMGVELFVTGAGLIVNEIAPRVHNSGHWTQDGCAVDQFEQHIRAITGWPLGDGSRYCDVRMENLIGQDVGRVKMLAGEKNVALHLYGKAEIKAGRKMGHLNRILAKETG